MLRIKPGVSLRGIRPEIAISLQIVDGAFSRAGCNETWVTSGTEGKHSRGSLHYVGAAVDIRLPPPVDRTRIIQDIKDSLGSEFDAVLESTHIHIEFQPKAGLNL